MSLYALLGGGGGSGESVIFGGWNVGGGRFISCLSWGCSVAIVVTWLENYGRVARTCMLERGVSVVLIREFVWGWEDSVVWIGGTSVPWGELPPSRWWSTPCIGRFVFGGEGSVPCSAALLPCGGEFVFGGVDVIIRSCSVDCWLTVRIVLHVFGIFTISFPHTESNIVTQKVK